MAFNIFFTGAGSATVSDPNVSVVGAAGAQTVKLTAAATGIRLDPNIERVEFSGALASYTFNAIAGVGVQVFSGTTLVATIPSLNQNATFAFSNGSVVLAQSGGSAFTLGGTALTNSATAAVVVPVTIAAADVSTVPGAGGGVVPGVGQTFSLTAGVDAFVGLNADDTITGASGTVADGDIIVDQSSTDNDTANLVVTSKYTPSTITNIETINLDWNAFGTAEYDLVNVAGAKQVNLTSSKVGYLGGATVTNAKGNTINTGAGTVGALSVTGVTAAGATINADKAATVTVTGTGTTAKATVIAGANATSVTTSVLTNATIDAGKAATISVTDVNTSSQTTLTVNANADITNGVKGKLTLNAADGNKIDMGANAIGTEMTVGGTGNVELTFAADALAAKTLVNAKTAGTLTIKSADINGEDVSKIQADLVEFTAAAAGQTIAANGQKLKYSGAAGAIDIATAGDGKADVVNAAVSKNQTSLAVDESTETLKLTVEVATLVAGTDLTIGTVDLQFSEIANKVVINGTLDLAITSLTAANKNNLLDATTLVGDLIVGTADSVQVSGGTGKLNLTTTGTNTEVVVVGQSANDTVTASVDSGTLSAILGDGVNKVTAAALIGGTLVVNAGSGNDTVAVGGAISVGTVTSGTVNLNLGAGNNDATVRTTTTSTAKVTVLTGAGDDTVTFGGVTAATAVISINTGLGNDTLKLDAAAGLGLGTVTLAGIETIVIDVTAANATNAVFQAATLSGQSFVVKGAAAAATTTDGTGFTVNGKASTTTVDLSGLNVSRDVTSNVNAVKIDTTTAAQGVIITGSNVKDTILGSAFGDTITVTKGGSEITAGAGNDTINITQSVANQAVDTIVFDTAATNGQDRIVGFKSNTDVITVQTADTTVATAIVGVTAAVVAEDEGGALLVAAGTFTLVSDTATNAVVELSLALSSFGTLSTAIDGSELLKALGSSATTAATSITVGTAGDKFFLVAYQAGNAYLYHVDSGADILAVAGEIKLVGTLEGIVAGSLVAADFGIV